MAYSRREVQDHVTIMNKDLYDNLQDGIEERGVTPEMFGAVGDGVHDDTEAIQYALNHYDKVMLLGKTYLVSDTLYISSNKEFSGIYGKSVIRNNVNFGHGKTMILTGDIGGNLVPNASSPISRPRNVVKSITRGKIELVNKPNFTVGDAVFLFELSDGGKSFECMDFAVVTGVGSTYINVDNFTINDELITHTLTSEVYVVNLTTSIKANSDDNSSESWITHDIYIHDMTLEMMYPNTGSGMYAIGLASYDCRIERVNMRNVTTPFGANMCCRTVIKDCDMYFTGGVSDFAELNIRCDYHNLHFYRCGYNSEHENEGLSVHGYGAFFDNVHIHNLDKSRGFRLSDMLDFTLVNCSFNANVENPVDNDIAFIGSNKDGKNYMINCVNNSNIKMVNAYVTCKNCVNNGLAPFMFGYESILIGCVNKGLITTYHFVNYQDKTDMVIADKCVYSSGFYLGRINAGDLKLVFYPRNNLTGVEGFRIIPSLDQIINIRVGEETILDNVSVTHNTMLDIHFNLNRYSGGAYLDMVVNNDGVISTLSGKILQGFLFTSEFSFDIIVKNKSGYLFIDNVSGYFLRMEAF